VAGSGNEKGNVTIVNTANVGDTQVSIRGIVSTRDAESTFACVVDGVLITNPNAFNGELIDIAQIEVLKGRMELALALRYDEEDRSVSNQVPNVLSSGLNINLAGQPINPAYTQFPGVPQRWFQFHRQRGNHRFLVQRRFRRAGGARRFGSDHPG
jgi:hypothetical protein